MKNLQSLIHRTSTNCTSLLTIAIAFAACFGWSTELSAQSLKHKLLFDRLSLYYDSTCQPGKLLKLSAVISNKDSQPFDGVVVVKIQGLPDQQFEQPAQFPALGSYRMELDIPVPLTWKEKSHIEFEATIFSRQSSGDVMLDIDGVPVRQTLKIPLEREPIIVSTSYSPGLFSLPWWYWPQSPPDYAYEGTIASKISVGGNRLTLGQRNRPLPASLAEWQMLDVFVLNDPQPLSDAYNLDSMARFIDGGGTVWAMLDKVPLNELEQLLGPGHSVEVLDSVQLRNFVVELRDSPLQSISLVDRTLKLDEPANLVRVVQSGGEVMCSIDEWPVAIVFRQGHGKLILSTLEMHAWLQPRGNRTQDFTKDSILEPRTWCSYLCKNIVGAASPTMYPRGTLGYEQPDYGREYAHSQIGNPVVPRNTVASILTGFLVVLCSVATWCWWRGSWQLAMIATPTVAAVFAGVTMFVTSGVRRDIQEMSASLSIAQTSFSGNAAVVHQQGAMHLTNQRDLTLSSATNGSAWVNSDEVPSGIKRLRYSGFQEWKLSNQNWPSGVWGYQAEYVEPRDSMFAEGQFTAEGLELRLPKELADLEDCVVSLQRGQLMLAKKVGDHLLVDGTSPASEGRWTTMSVLNDEQRRRQIASDDLFNPEIKGRSLKDRLIGWSKNAGMTKWSGDIHSVNSTLEILPIRILTPDLNQEVLVPAGAIGIATDFRVTGRSSAFREESGSWEPNTTQATKIALRCFLPGCLQSFEAKTITLALDISAPHRSVEIINNSGREERLLATLNGPSVPWSQSFASDQISFDQDGAFHLLIKVGERQDAADDGTQSSIVKWRINRFHISSQGQRKASLN
jgi:hypothetical protein